MYLCCVESLSSFRSKLDFLRFFKVTPKSGKSPCTMLFSHLLKCFVHTLKRCEKRCEKSILKGVKKAF